MSLAEHVAEARVMYEGGATPTEVGETFGVSRNTVSKHLRRAGVFIRPKGNSHRTGPAPSAAELRYRVHEAHQPYHEVAADYGVAPATIGLWLDSHGIPRAAHWASRYKGRPLPTVDQITALYETGLSMRAVADHFGVGTGFVTKRLRVDSRNNWPADYGRGHATGADGHVVRSSIELLVCDHLTVVGVPHVYEPRLPFSGHWRADFYALGHFIEIWGWAGPNYDARRARKTTEYAKYDVPVLHLDSADFRSDWRAKLDELRPPKSSR